MKVFSIKGGGGGVRFRVSVVQFEMHALSFRVQG